MELYPMGFNIKLMLLYTFSIVVIDRSTHV